MLPSTFFGASACHKWDAHVSTWKDQLVPGKTPTGIFSAAWGTMHSIDHGHSYYSRFCEVKTAPTECKEKCFQMMSSAYLQNVLMLMIHLRKRPPR